MDGCLPASFWLGRAESGEAPLPGPLSVLRSKTATWSVSSLGCCCSC
jgi:hypothetical protein